MKYFLLVVFAATVVLAVSCKNRDWNPVGSSFPVATPTPGGPTPTPGGGYPTPTHTPVAGYVQSSNLIGGGVGSTIYCGYSLYIDGNFIYTDPSGACARRVAIGSHTIQIVIGGYGCPNGTPCMLFDSGSPTGAHGTTWTWNVNIQQGYTYDATVLDDTAENNLYPLCPYITFMAHGNVLAGYTPGCYVPWP